MDTTSAAGVIACGCATGVQARTCRLCFSTSRWRVRRLLCFGFGCLRVVFSASGRGNPSARGNRPLGTSRLKQDADPNTAAIVGGTIAGVLALLLIAGAGVWLRKRRRDTRRETMAYALRLQNRMSLAARDGKAGQAEQAGA
ncbi:hypothetical protein FIBSPDRAFT_899432 [Athelia psychrophila]|uniref:Gram-positive cocci surface proteins LPxTG domain-containing protein n=1 Tax=Athelia psychrophila TaxID=1759441 RepID=A0A165ZPD5_9AGAM|nr:hypothetical protein FIBSPDRAFT_899432 [Fibularhizoctonia sp. CBS 109695]